ncbi:MAG: shikimate dehydrogenase [Dehalococcoidia bacterium]|nr:MAG: shikimate dehydrogenase [Dehalococcoidia bacterium]
MINATTRLCGVIGDPVSHTLSPAMHNAVMASLGLDYAYLAFRVKSTELGTAIQGMKALGIRGLNVTIPHKAAVVPLLDELDPLARDIGAVNTIVNDNGRLKGYNTDASGFLQSLLAASFNPQGKRIVLMGAGGAARAIGFALAQSGASITVLNRKIEMEQAVLLAQNLSRVAKSKVDALELDAANLKTALVKADLLVNATSVGMSPGAGDTPVPAHLLRSSLTVFDVVYAPLETRLLREAAARGCRVISGLEMLVRQGALAFELWTGKEAPLDMMRQAALVALTQGKDGKHSKKAKEPAKVKTSVALIGFMGAGKSSVGRALARKLKKTFVDVDKLIEKKAGKSIAHIFKEDGEPAFRELERVVTAEVARQAGQVIACGGGVVLNKSNTDALRKTAVLVYLKASEGAVRKRVSSAKGKRPLLANIKGAKSIEVLMAQRRPLYEQASDITLDTSRLGIEDAADKIIERLGEYEGFRL